MHSQLKTWLEIVEDSSCDFGGITSKWSLVCIYAVKTVRVDYNTDPNHLKAPRVYREGEKPDACYTTFVSYIQLREMQGYPMSALPDGTTAFNALLGDEDEKV